MVDAAAPDAIDQVTTVRGVLYKIGARSQPELLAPATRGARSLT